MIKNIKTITKKLRKLIIYLNYKKKTAHLGSSLSCVEIIAILYFKFLKINKDNFKSAKRNYFILSKGHAALSLYACLYLKKIISKKLLTTYSDQFSSLEEHPNIKIPGVECSTGSLGHGLPFACGLAMNKIIYNKKNKIFVLLSDGECNEGSVWESFLFASKHKLNNLNIIIDFNQWQATDRSIDVLDISNLEKKLNQFHFSVFRIDGNNLRDLDKVLKIKTKNTKVIIAYTIKGKGVSFMEDDNNWHYRSPNRYETLKSFKQINKSN